LIFSQSLYWRINVMLSIVTAPEWAREQGVNVDRHGPARTNDLYVNFVRAILERYPGQVFAIEVWNEQNLDREWTSLRGLSASNYVSLLRDTYNMVQEVSSGTIVISGALSPTGLDDGIGAIDDFRYMEQMINAGMLDVVDCVGAHHNGYNIGPTVVYTNVPNDPTAIFRGPFDNPHHSWSFRSTLEGYTQRIRAAGSDKKLCVTEFGWAVTEDLDGTPRGFEFADDNSLEEQAQFFADALEYMESGGNVWLAFIWNLNYGPQANWDPTNDNTPYSLIGPGFEFRPAFDAIREWYAAYEQRIGRT
jgi:polysaccharide biosynthesis protein PslG